MKGINTGSWWKFFIFPAKNTLSLIRNAERHFYSPLRKIFLFFRLIEYLKAKNTHLFQVNALSKFPYFVVCDAYSETFACLLKCNCQQLYFHVGMGTLSPSSLLLVSNTKLSKWQYCFTRVDLALVFSPHQIGLWYLDATLKILWCSLIIMNSCLLSISLLDLYVILW